MIFINRMKEKQKILALNYFEYFIFYAQQQQQQQPQKLNVR